MAQRNRETYGFSFDPVGEDDLKWDEEFSSADYDSDDIHSSIEGDQTDHGNTSDKYQESKEPG